MRSAAGVALIVLGSGLALSSAGYAEALLSEVNPDSAIVAEFQKRVATYVQVRKDIESKLPALKPTGSVDKITHSETQLAKQIRMARANARQGDIFTPDITAEMKRLIALAMKPDGRKITTSLKHAEPVELHLKINDSYPHHVPLQSTPPSLLENLPMLPPEIEYRVVGADLVLLDVRANLVIDFIPSAVVR